MPHSVILTTPMPTWEETADFYRLSKAQRKFVEGLFEDKTPKRRAGAAAPSSRSAKAKKNGANASGSLEGR
jgi:hypothetical protein